MKKSELRFLPTGKLDTRGRRQLKPCPFCGNNDIEIKKEEIYGNLIKIYCSNCCGSITASGIKKTHDRWNKRTPIVQQQISGSADATRKLPSFKKVALELKDMSPFYVETVWRKIKELGNF